MPHTCVYWTDALCWRLHHPLVLCNRRVGPFSGGLIAAVLYELGFRPSRSQARIYDAFAHVS